jgi:hypothetical protein
MTGALLLLVHGITSRSDTTRTRLTSARASRILLLNLRWPRSTSEGTFMRPFLALVGLLTASAALTSCAPRRSVDPASAPLAPVVLRGEPTCTFRVIGRISGGSGLGYGDTPLAKARALGADAVMDYRETPIFDSTNRQSGSTWEAIAIKYSDASNTNCQRSPDNGRLR